MRRVSSGPSGNNPVIVTGTNWPLTSICGRLPGEKIKSLTRVEARSIAESKAAAGIAGLAATLFGTEKSSSHQGRRAHGRVPSVYCNLHEMSSI